MKFILVLVSLMLYSTVSYSKSSVYNSFKTGDIVTLTGYVNDVPKFKVSKDRRRTWWTFRLAAKMKKRGVLRPLQEI